VLTIYEDADRIFEALRAGACGDLVKGQRRRACWKVSATRWTEVRPCLRIYDLTPHERTFPDYSFLMANS
jgi:hypothetical protein